MQKLLTSNFATFPKQNQQQVISILSFKSYKNKNQLYMGGLHNVLNEGYPTKKTRNQTNTKAKNYKNYITFIVVKKFKLFSLQHYTCKSRSIFINTHKCHCISVVILARQK
jgi:hypothetical protein